VISGDTRIGRIFADFRGFLSSPVNRIPLGDVLSLSKMNASLGRKIAIQTTVFYALKLFSTKRHIHSGMWKT